MKLIVATAVFAMTSGMAMAATWSHEDDKGLQIYTLVDGETRLELVCDPDKLWEPAEFHLIMKRNGTVIEDATVTASKGESSVTLPMMGGAVVAQDKDAWEQLVGLMSEAGTVSFQAGTHAFSVAFDAQREGNCSAR